MKWGGPHLKRKGKEKQGRKSVLSFPGCWGTPTVLVAGTGPWKLCGAVKSPLTGHTHSQAPWYHCSPSQAPLRGWWFGQTSSPTVKARSMLQHAKLGTHMLYLLSKWNDILKLALIGSNLGCQSCPSCLKHSQAPFCDDFLRRSPTVPGRGVFSLSETRSVKFDTCNQLQKAAHHKAAQLAYSVTA